MVDPNSLFYSGRTASARDRTLREVESLPPDNGIPEQDEYQNRINAAYNKLAKTINAANAVLPFLEKMAKAISIPVDELADDVRSAVIRKDQNVGDGSQIRFDLFRDAIENYDRLRANISIQAASRLDGNPPLDAHRIDRLRRELENGDLDATELTVFSSIFLARMLLSRLTEQFTVPNVVGMVAGKYPPGTEQGSSTSAILTSIFTTLLMESINIVAMELADRVNNDSGAQTVVQTENLVSEAQTSPPELNSLEELAIRKVGEADYQLILEYALNFISNSFDPKYHAWMGYLDAKQSRNRAIEHYRFGPQYSSEEIKLLNNLEDPVPVSIETDTTITTRLPDRSLTPGILSTLDMNPGHLCMIEERATALSENLALVVQVLSSARASQEITCMGRFFIRVDEDIVTALRAIMAFSQGLLQEQLTINIMQTMTNVLNYLGNAIKDFLLMFMEKVLLNVAEPVINFLDKEDDDWELVFSSCFTLQFSLDYVIKTIEQLASKFRSLIDGIGFDGLQVDQNIGSRWTDVHEMREIKLVIEILDQVLSFIDSPEADTSSSFSIDDSNLISISDYLQAVQSDYTLNLPQDIIEEHFSDSQPIAIPENETRPEYTIPAIGREDTSTEPMVMKEILKRCGRTISDEELDRILRTTNGTS